MTTAPGASLETIESKKDKLVTDLKGVVADADDLLKQVASSTTDEFVAARSRIEARLGQAISSLRVARIEATRKACNAADATHDYVRDNPWKIVGVTATGLLAAFLVSRYSAK